MKICFPPIVATGCVLFSLAASGLAADQPAELAPKQSPAGVVFQFEAPEAEVVYLAGSFNNWANNHEGQVSDEAFAMAKDAETGRWSRTVKLPPGEHKFQFVVDGPASGTGLLWVVPAYVVERDADGNGILRISRTGAVYLGQAVDEKLRPRKEGGEVTFQFRAPDAHMVYLAGDFNNWADNRDGQVVLQSAAMEGPDEEGVWKKTVPLSSGTHHYQFVIDGETWVRDPNEEGSLENHSLVRVE